jgi:excisionase family DNA binding protein
MSVTRTTHISTLANIAMQGDRIMDSAEAAAYINVSRKTLLRYCKAGLISYIPYRGKHQFRKSALDYFVSKNEVKV